MTLAQSICGSYGYMAPELFTGKGYDPLKADLFIVGALLHFMVYDDLLEIDLDEFDSDVEKLAVDYVNNDTKVSFQSKAATEPLYQKVNSLILDLTRGNPEERPTLEQVSESLKLI